MGKPRVELSFHAHSTTHTQEFMTACTMCFAAGNKFLMNEIKSKASSDVGTIAMERGTNNLSNSQELPVMHNVMMDSERSA